jgi:hypothetical protein
MMGRTAAVRAGRRRLLSLCLFAGLLALGVAVVRLPAAGAEGGGALVAEPVLSATSAGVRQLFGASPLEEAGEVWGVGKAPGGEDIDIVRYTEAGGWEAVPDPIGPEEETETEIRIPETASAGRTTPAGGVVTVASLGSDEAAPMALVVRDPGGPVRAIVPPEGVLKGEERLFEYNVGGSSSWIKLAAVEEPGGKTGAFVVPSPGKGLNTELLHYDGSSWRREPVCLNAPPAPCQKPGPGFGVIAIDADEVGNAWLLAKVPRTGPFTPGEGIVLLRREVGEWRKQTLGGALGALYGKEESTVAGSKVFVFAREQGQPLTATSKGVWVDAGIAVGSNKEPRSDATIYYDVDQSDPGNGQVTGSWCDLQEATPGAVRESLCKGPLGSDLPSGQARSFAWPGSSAGEFGTRAITGVGQGAMLIFENGAFTRVPLAGNGGTSAGAALTAPDEGWLGPSYRLTRAPVPSGIVPWPVPFRRPLTAIAPQPGAPIADLSSSALAVGARGQIARYLPGQGWQPESLLTGSGSRATPNLRAVAWPVPGRAYAVGDEGAMWLWRAGSGLWEPDPGAPPNLIRGDFTGIAFDPGEPERGYAVGKQGLLLGYGRGWAQEALPPGLSPEANFTSIAFAGDEALATWTLAIPSRKGRSEPEYVGGLIVNSGSGWQVEPQAPEALLNGEAGLGEVAPWRVAGLPDGGAVIAGITGGVIEREGVGAPWHGVGGSPLGYPSALAAIREGGQVRGVLSVEGNPIGESTESLVRLSDRAQAVGQPPAGQASLLTEPYPLPKNGYVVRQTTSGWRDEERQSYPPPPVPEGQSARQVDMPRVPDPVLALLVNPEGSQGWAVGGQTGEVAPSQPGYLKEGLQTGSAMRYGDGATPPANAATVGVPLPAGEATFAVGGNAQCVGLCADLGGTGIGPDVWLRAAVGKAAGIAGLRAFLYAGAGVSGALDQSKVSRFAFGEEEEAYASRLGSAAGSLPVFAAPAESDLYKSSLDTFAAKFAGFGAPLGSAPPGPGITPTSAGNRAAGNYSYSFESRSSSGAEPVRVLVLDYPTAPLATEEQCWLAQQLAEAKVAGSPAIVVGNREVGADASLLQLLVTGANGTTATTCPQAAAGGASAYFFDRPEGNTASSLSWGSASIPTFGTGTLGYTKIPETQRNQYISASGFLLASVDTASRNPSTNVAPVTASLIPSIGSLAIDAVDGTLLRRSQTALFQALARRPVAGISCTGNQAPRTCDNVKPDSYMQIPARCLGQLACASEILPEYSFTSSRPDIADFVAVDPASANPRAVLLKNGKPVADPRSGLLCAFNSGQTTITVATGGLSYSVPLTVQKGSVQRPCGTVPRTDLPAPAQAVAPPPAPAPSQSPGYKTPPGTLPPPPAPAPAPGPAPTPAPTPTPVVHHQPAPTPPAPVFFAPAPVITPIVAIVPPPPPPAAQTTPPSGTSPVFEPAVSPEPEEEDEVAIDIVHHMAAWRPSPATPAALRASGGGGEGGGNVLRYGLPALVLLAALASAGIARPRRRTAPLAPALSHAPRRTR